MDKRQQQQQVSLFNNPKFIETQKFINGKVRVELTKMMARTIDVERFMNVLVTCAQKNEKLIECDQLSLMASVRRLAQVGLEPDGRLAYLLPYYNKKKGCYEAQETISYMGLISLIMRSGYVSYVHADIVCENDDFEYNMGQIIHHRINLKQPRGKMYAAYAMCKMKDGSHKAEVMHIDDINVIRARSSSANSGPWVSDYHAMCKKTCVRQLAKWLDLTPITKDVIGEEDARMESERVIEGARIYEKKDQAMVAGVPVTTLPFRPQLNAEVSEAQSKDVQLPHDEIDEEFEALKMRLLDAEDLETLHQRYDEMREDMKFLDPKKSSFLEALYEGKILELTDVPM